MRIEIINRLALITLCSSTMMFIIGIICGLSGSSFGLLISFAIGIVGMMIHEWLATYIEAWYNDCDDEKL